MRARRVPGGAEAHRQRDVHQRVRQPHQAGRRLSRRQGQQRGRAERQALLQLQQPDWQRGRLPRHVPGGLIRVSVQVCSRRSTKGITICLTVSILS